MLQAVFHAWERRLARVTTDRVVRPFEWGLDWIPSQRPCAGVGPPGTSSSARGSTQRDGATPTRSSRRRRQREYTLGPAHDRRRAAADVSERLHHAARREQHGLLPLLSAARRAATRRPRAAVLVLPQWNSDAGGHVGLCRLLAMNGMTALRLSLPYHDQRMPPELHRADYIVSANVARTVQVCRQAVLDARRAIAWLAARATSASAFSARASDRVCRC